MKIFTIIALFLIISIGLLAQPRYPKDEVTENQVEFIRTNFYAAIENSEKNDEQIEYIQNVIKKQERESAFLTAYFGASETLIAKHSYNPYTKLKYLTKGLDKIETALNQYPNSLELRFLRFSILHYIPAIVGYSKEREEDLNRIYKLLLEKDYSEIDLKIQEGIVTFLIESERLKPAQIQKLRTLIMAKK